MPKVALVTALTLVLGLPVVFAANASVECPTSLQGRRAAAATASAAIAAAKPELVRKFSAQKVARYAPYSAKLTDGVWHIQGHLPTHMLGGTPEAKVCQATGRVLNVYHTR